MAGTGLQVTTVTPGRSDDIWGRRRVGMYRVTLDTSYETGGYTFDPKAYGFQGVVQVVHCNLRYGATLNGVPVYDYANKKIVLLTTGTGATGTTMAQPASGVDASSVSIDVTVIGD